MLKVLGDVVLNIAFWGFIAGYMISPHPAHPRAPINRVARHGGRLSIAGAFWILAALRSAHEHSIKPLLHRAEYRGIVRLLRR